MITDTMLSVHQLLLAQEGSFSDITVVTPPGDMEGKTKLILGLGLWLATAALIGLAMYCGFTFAKSFADGQASRGEKFAFIGCGIGAVLVAGASSFVTFFM
ncbi:hypothetical protein [Rhodococcus rhodnii]|uniref:hypothetical protein n=1 Tax=Rhodococcus rhodnii TaxID=38312 RepID=UPI0009324081|nr:hypothetical protein [Rhodococcus rhodnii]